MEWKYCLLMMDQFRYFFERHGFSVCSRLAEWMGIRAKNVRLFFIYISFFSLGFNFAVYLTIAFWLKIKDFISSKRSSVFDL